MQATRPPTGVRPGIRTQLRPTTPRHPRASPGAPKGLAAVPALVRRALLGGAAGGKPRRWLEMLWCAATELALAAGGGLLAAAVLALLYVVPGADAATHPDLEASGFREPIDLPLAKRLAGLETAAFFVPASAVAADKRLPPVALDSSLGVLVLPAAGLVLPRRLSHLRQPPLDRKGTGSTALWALWGQPWATEAGVWCTEAIPTHAGVISALELELDRQRLWKAAPCGTGQALVCPAGIEAERRLALVDEAAHLVCRAAALHSGAPALPPLERLLAESTSARDRLLVLRPSGDSVTSDTAATLAALLAGTLAQEGAAAVLDAGVLLLPLRPPQARGAGFDKGAPWWRALACVPGTPDTRVPTDLRLRLDFHRFQPGADPSRVGAPKGYVAPRHVLNATALLTDATPALAATLAADARPALPSHPSPQASVRGVLFFALLGGGVLALVLFAASFVRIFCRAARRPGPKPKSKSKPKPKSDTDLQPMASVKVEAPPAVLLPDTHVVHVVTRSTSHAKTSTMV